MDNKERTQAANALIEWFNSQEISQSDAKAVMAKVIAKICVSSKGDTVEVRKLFDAYLVHLADEFNNRAYQVIHGKRADGR